MKRFVLTICAVVFAQGCRAGSVEENLALGRKCVFSPQPNYKLCTDDNDVFQLTDGKKNHSKWTSASTVGWVRTGTIEIEMDMGTVSDIDRVLLYSVGGGWASVEYPEFIVVSVSTDGKRFGVAGLLRTDGVMVASGRKEPRVFEIRDLNVRVRYLRLLIRSQGERHHFFADEVEVYGRRVRERATVRYASGLVAPVSRQSLLDGIEEYFQIVRNVEQIELAVQSRNIRLKEALGDSMCASFQSYVGMFLKSGTDFPDASHMKDIHHRIGLMKAAILKHVYGKPLLCYPADPMEMVLEKEMPSPDPEDGSGVEVFQWQNEYESAAINVVNCSPKSLQCRVSISPLADKGSGGHASEDVITVRRAVYVRAMNLGQVADALVLQQDKAFTLEPGELTQIWLTINSSRLSPGSYSGSIAVAAGEGQLQVVPLNIEVAPVRFPDRVTLRSCVWDQYITSSKSFTRMNPSAAFSDLREHYVNIGVVHPFYIPYPGNNRTRLQSADFEGLDRQLELRKDYDCVLLYLDADDYVEKKIQGEWMSETWKAGFVEWLNEMVVHLKSKGFDYSRFALYPYDERIHDKFYELARLIKLIDPKVQIYCDWFIDGPSKFMRFKDLVDIWCLQDGHCDLYPGWAETISRFGRPVWTYEGFGPGKASRPLKYRELAWKAFMRNQTGAGFWVYLDWQSQPGWDDTEEPEGYYRVIYDGRLGPADSISELVVTSRRWEAWREGIEDFQYLWDLRAAIEQARPSNAARSEKAQEVLEEQVRGFLKWRQGDSKVNISRRVLTEELIALESE